MLKADTDSPEHLFPAPHELEQHDVLVLALVDETSMTLSNEIDIRDLLSISDQPDFDNLLDSSPLGGLTNQKGIVQKQLDIKAVREWLKLTDDFSKLYPLSILKA